MARKTDPAVIEAAQEVARTGRRRVIRADGRQIAVLVPYEAATGTGRNGHPERAAGGPTMSRRSHRPKPLTADNPLFEIIGSITDDLGSDVSENVDKYLAEAYASEFE